MVMLQVRKRRKKPQPRGLRPPTTFEKFLGWCVHGYTALGLGGGRSDRRVAAFAVAPTRFAGRFS